VIRELSPGTTVPVGHPHAGESCDPHSFSCFAMVGLHEMPTQCTGWQGCYPTLQAHQLTHDSVVRNHVASHTHRPTGVAVDKTVMSEKGKMTAGDSNLRTQQGETTDKLWCGQVIAPISLGDAGSATCRHVPGCISLAIPDCIFCEPMADLGDSGTSGIEHRACIVLKTAHIR
jgi:hypothetical protein